MCVCAAGACGAHLEMVREHMTGLPNDRDLDVEVKIAPAPWYASAIAVAGAQTICCIGALHISVDDRILTQSSEIAVELNA